MSNRSMLEFNHDFWPSTDSAKREWGIALLRYLSGGDPRDLPNGVTWFGTRHHSETCPLGNPPRGWQNERSTALDARNANPPPSPTPPHLSPPVPRRQLYTPRLARGMEVSLRKFLAETNILHERSPS